MANFQAIKAAIDAYIKRNGQQEITGDILNNILNEMLLAVNNKKQDTLVSGENIKTINGQSLLGGGNIEVVFDDTQLREIIATKVDATYVDNAIASAITNTLNTEV